MFLSLVCVGTTALVAGCGDDGSRDSLPDQYLQADISRGAQLYDKFWSADGMSVAEPTTAHPLYPDIGEKDGSTTWRCKECHGWDYIGKDGRYSSGSHFTGIVGLYPARLPVTEVFDIIMNDHGYGAAGLSDADVWDLVRFYNEGMADVASMLDGQGSFAGDAERGKTLFEEGIGGGAACASCHGTDGLSIPPGGDPDYDAFVGFLSNDNPQEFQHKAHFGQPGSDMVITFDDGASAEDIADLGAYSQTLSQTAQ